MRESPPKRRFVAQTLICATHASGKHDASRVSLFLQYVFAIGPRDRFARSDQSFLFKCEAEVAMVAALHDRLRALELDVTLADFVGKSVVAGAE
jgi:hypothetical protein